MHESNWSGWSWLLWGLYFTAAFPIEVGSELSEVEAGSRMVSSRPDMRKIRSGCLKVVMEATQSWGSPSARAAGFRTVHHFTVMVIMSKCVTWCSQSLFRWGRPAAKGSRSVEKLTTGLFFFFFFYHHVIVSKQMSYNCPFGKQTEWMVGQVLAVLTFEQSLKKILKSTKSGSTSVCNVH